MAGNEDNPYMSMIGIMRRQGEMNNPLPFLLGLVTGAEPLVIQVEGVPYQREDFLINDALLKGIGYQERITAQTVSGEVSVAGEKGTLNSFSMTEGTVTRLSGLQAGDRVIILVSADRQQMVVLCRVR